MALSKFSAASSSTASVPEDPDCVIFEFNEAVGVFYDQFAVSAGVTHSDKQKEVTAESLKKNWRIDESTAKGTIETITQLNRQDVGSKLVTDLCNT